MITKLDQLTAAEFIDLVCGSKDVLLGKHEVPNPYKMTIALRNIIMEYRSIADPGGNASYLKRVDVIIKSRIAVTVYSMCKNLILLKRFDKARDILIASGLSADGWNDKRVESEVHIQLQKNKRAIEDADKDDESAEEEKENLRNAFNGMIAAMMAHFRFQIDIAKMMAPVFAHLVARYHAEVKAMRKAMKSY